MSKRRSFVGEFREHVAIGDWVTARELALRITPNATREMLLELSRDHSRRLSNLERYGHVRRRCKNGVFEYARAETPATVQTMWYPT
jgi:hypothetical protein